VPPAKQQENVAEAEGLLVVVFTAALSFGAGGIYGWPYGCLAVIPAFFLAGTLVKGLGRKLRALRS